MDDVPLCDITPLALDTYNEIDLYQTVSMYSTENTYITITDKIKQTIQTTTRIDFKIHKINHSIDRDGYKIDVYLRKEDG